MAKVIKPPKKFSRVDGKTYVFLAGSIEMGKAINWQEKVEQHYAPQTDIVFLNPRRDDWDSSWIQRASNAQFNTQVNWELDGLELADIIFMYYDEDTKAPITLLELGRFAKSGKIICVCPEKFWRVGNVEIVCARDQIPLVHTLEDGLILLSAKLNVHDVI